MMLRTGFSAALILAAMLAGCSDAPPSGEIADLGPALSLDGTASITITEERKPLEEQAMRDLPEETECAADAIPEQPQLHCVDPMTEIGVMLHTAPEPVGGTYQAFLAGTSPAEALGELAMSADGMYTVNKTINEDLSLDEAGFDRIEIRFGDFVLATAPLADGDQDFALASGVEQVSATGEYKGKKLTVTISGLPANGTYTAHLYQPGDDGVTPVSVENFPVMNGENVIEAEKTLDKYVQFHIHVGTSKINLFQAAIE